eukprot:3396992-Rhodomonas_salina.2
MAAAPTDIEWLRLHVTRTRRGGRRASSGGVRGGGGLAQLWREQSRSDLRYLPMRVLRDLRYEPMRSPLYLRGGGCAKRKGGVRGTDWKGAGVRTGRTVCKAGTGYLNSGTDWKGAGVRAGRAVCRARAAGFFVLIDVDGEWRVAEEEEASLDCAESVAAYEPDPSISSDGYGTCFNVSCHKQ